MDFYELMENYHQQNLQQNIPSHIYKIIKNYSHYTFTRPDGRTFQNAIYGLNNAISSYTVLYDLMRLISPTHKTLYFDTQYTAFSTDNAPTELADIVSLRTHYVSARDTDFYRINVVHIPRGTTFVSNCLNEIEKENTITRLKTVELQLINGPTHYLKVFKHNDQTTPTYSILTNWVDKQLLHKIFLFIPIIIGWNYHSQEHLEDLKAANKSEELAQCILENMISSLFTTLYDCFKDKTDVTPFTQLFKEVCNAIIEIKELNKLNYTEFMNNFANAINNKIVRITQRDYDNIKANIANNERMLNEYYAKKEVLERQLSMAKTSTPDDVASFLDVIKQSKAIEILDADDKELRLKITAPLQFFTSSDFERYEQNGNSYYNTHMYGADAKYTKPIFHKIFVTHEYKLLLGAVVEVKINDSTYDEQVLYVNARGGSAQVKSELTAVPNPHLYQYDCWAKTKNMIQKAIADKNYDLVPTLIVNSVQTINIAEPQSFQYLLDYLADPFWRQKVTILNKENKPLSWKEAIEVEKTNYKTMTTAVDVPTVKPLEEATTPEGIVQTTNTGYTQIVIDDEIDV